MKRLFGSATLAMVLGAWSLTGLSSCAVAPDQRHYADGLVLVAPPAPQVEVIGTPPQAGYLWVAYEWVRQGDGWRLRRGHWQRS
jgi:hypothetical protein